MTMGMCRGYLNEWCYDLLPVLGSRPSIKPFITTDAMLDSSESSDDDDDDCDDDDNSNVRKMNTSSSTPFRGRLLEWGEYLCRFQ